MTAGERRRIWLVQIGEPLPVDGQPRLHRTGLLADVLAEMGHHVVWWAATFDHASKRHLFSGATSLALRPNLELRLLHGISYASNVSLRRVVNQIQLARNFRQLAASEPLPQVILASLPPVELAGAAVAFARRHGIPAVVDVRDLWPDILVDVVPTPLRFMARTALCPMFRAARRALEGADSVVAVSPSYLRWGLRYAGRPPGPRDKVIPLGYPRSSASQSELDVAGRELRSRGVDPGRQIAWFVGMFGRMYDIDTVIAAARSLAAGRGSDIQFVLSGAGEKETQWREAAHGLPNVIFTGWVDQPKITWLLKSAWVGLAAYVEGAPQSLPNKLFEYMSGGLPVVSSLGGDAEELLRTHDCGATYRAGDANDLASKVLMLSEDDARRARLGANGRAAFEKYYVADSVYRDMAAYLLSAAEEGRAGGDRRREG